MTPSRARKLATAPLHYTLREAKRWYNVAARLAGREPARQPSTKGVRLSYQNKWRSIREKLVYLYGAERGLATAEKITRKIKAFEKKKPRALKLRDARFNPRGRFTEQEALFITYPDSFRAKNEAPLATLDAFTKHYLDGWLNTVHVLPFYPSSGDRGFAVKNYKRVEKKFGTWQDVRSLATHHHVMVDGVFNHVSTKGRWFKEWRRGNDLYENHFIAFKQKNELAKENVTKITRPRTSDLLTPFKTVDGTRYVWTTFSKEQADLNWKEPRVFLRVVDALFRYARNGATMIRLDAVNYLWKEIGTSCSHLKQTHVIIQLFRDLFDVAAPSISLVTETNVPHSQNIKYFGNGRNEAQLVYNFTLPPLLLHSLYEGNARYLKRWAARLERTSQYATYCNFLASHDGVGVRPLERVLPQRSVQRLIKKARSHGCLVQYRTKPDGSRSPYELNTTWWNAVNNMNVSEPDSLRLNRYLASWAIAFSLKGVPGIWVHALFGSLNDEAAVRRSGVARDINRANLSYAKVKRLLARDSREQRVFEGVRSLLTARRSSPAFHPNAGQEILDGNDTVFAVARTSVDGQEKVLCVTNVTSQAQEYRVDFDAVRLHTPLVDMLGRKRYFACRSVARVHQCTLSLQPYETLWLKGKTFQPHS